VRGDVRLDGVQFGHEGDHPVLDGLDLHVAPGESLALVGATGSGKSTVAGLLARLYDPDGGRVLLDGHDLRELRLVDVRRAVALVFEETFLFSESVRENIRLAIARAILADPALLVLDDATSAVDATKEHEIRAALGEVMRGRTTLVIAHRPATIALADRVAVLEGGRIVEQGTHGELIRRSPRYRTLLALEEAAA
jgi:ATP-binding cassette subfamily B protein